MNSIKHYPKIIAAVLILMSATGFAQSSKKQAVSPEPASIAAESALKQSSSAKQELQNFKQDSGNPELSQLRYSLLELKVKRDRALSDNSLSNEEMQALELRIMNLETKVKAMNDSQSLNAAELKSNSDAGSAGNFNGIHPRLAKEREALNEANQSGQLTRKQFTSLQPSAQKDVLLKGYLITDLLNGNAENIRMANLNAIIIAADDFKNYSIDKQLHILNNPGDYLIVKDSKRISDVKPGVQEPPLTKYTITRSELKNYSPERRKAIEASPDFIITE